MKALTFKNNCINIAGWAQDLHLTHCQGYAYALPTHYVYLSGQNSPYSTWSFLEQNVTTTLEEWCQHLCGATNFEFTEYDVGIAINSVWRPGLHFAGELRSALAFNDEELSRASQALRLLVARLDEILLFIEPDAKFLGVYGHKTRDLLIAACTEVENYFQRYMNMAAATPKSGKFFTIKDYVRLQPRLFVDEFKIDMYAHPSIGCFAPFSNWNVNNIVLPWYDAYNKTKHHRDNEFAKASLINCIYAVGACLVLFSIRFGPAWWASNFINSPVPDTYRHFRQPGFNGDPRNVYVPLIDFPSGASGWSRGDHSGRVVWKTIAFSI
jgi:hypothetical protein